MTRATPLQVAQRAVIDALLDARDRLGDDAYCALLTTVEALVAKELHRLSLGEAMRITRQKP
jgi:hypothetical protein